MHKMREILLNQNITRWTIFEEKLFYNVTMTMDNHYVGFCIFQPINDYGPLLLTIFQSVERHIRCSVEKYSCVIYQLEPSFCILVNTVPSFLCPYGRCFWKYHVFGCLSTDFSDSFPKHAVTFQIDFLPSRQHHLKHQHSCVTV